MARNLNDNDIEKTLEEIFGIPDSEDGSEDGFESDEAEECNISTIQKVLESDDDVLLNSPTHLNSDSSNRSETSTSPKSPSTFVRQSDNTHNTHTVEEESSDESECDDESWGKDLWTSRPDPDEFDKVTIKPQYLLNRRARPVAHFRKFFNDDVFDLIVTQTNLYAEQKNIKNWQPVDKREISAFLGILIIMGYHILPQIDLYWSSDPGFRVNEVADIMPVKRFKKILEALHLNDNDQQPNRESPNFDKLYKIRPLISLLSNSFQNSATNSSSQSIDESMILFKGRSSLKQYMPLKPIKRGYKVWCCCDSSTGYLYNYEIYTGKTGQGTEEGLGANVVKKLSSKLVEEQFKTHVTFDNFFCDYSLMQYLYDKNIYATGTVRRNRAILPSIIKKKPTTTGRNRSLKLKKGEFKWRTKQDVAFTVWQDTKEVLLLTTAFHPKVGITSVLRTQKDGTRDAVHCPRVIKEYTKRMGGVDRFDQMKGTYAVGRRSKRWWLRIFYFLVDASITNSFILYSLASRVEKLTNLEYRVAVARGLIGGYTSRKRRYMLPTYVCKKLRIVCPENYQKSINSVPVESRYLNVGDHLPADLETYRRCKFCSTKVKDKRSKIKCGGGASPSVSVSTQADIAHSAKGYESEDENAGRKWQKASDERPASKTTMYSKQEFREQYCINNKQLDLLELEKSKKDRFLGCLSQYHIESPCSRANRASFLSVCVRRRVPSDENLNTDYAPIQRYPRFGQPSPAPPELCAYDTDLECSYFRRRPRSVCSQPDPKRYTWMPEDEDFTRMEWPQSVIEDNAGWPQNYNVDQIASVSRGGSLPRPPSIIPCPAHTPIPPPPPPPPLTIPPHRTKHVSFARSHTLTTFDDSVMPAAVSGNRFRRDCERLIDGRVVKPEPKPYSTLPVMFQPFPPYPQFMTQAAPAPIHYPPPITPHPSHPPPPLQRPTQTEQPKVVVLDSIKKGVMRTQATQTEVCLGRKPLPPNYLSLSPRTIKRVKMVAAGVQTNGYTVGVRRLTKSFSEVGGDRLAGRDSPTDIAATVESFITSDHEKLHRTQSEEPPRSPRSPTAMMIPSSPLQRGDSDDVTSSSVKSVASSSQMDKSSELSASQRQAQEYFQQNFHFIHESDRDDTIDDDIENIEKSMALNRRNLEYLQQEIAKQSKGDKSLRSILSKSTSDASQKTINSSHPFSKTSTFQSEPSTETSATTTDDSEKNEKEIIIDFEPRPDDEAIPFTTLRRKTRRMLQKTLSEGEILLDVRKTELQNTADGIKDAPIVMSTSQENMTREDREREAMYTQYIGQNYSQTPIKDEGIFGFEPDGSFSSSDGNAPYEDFHEKYISYKHEPFRNRSVSFEEKTEIIIGKDEIPESSTARSSPGSPEPVTIEADVEPKVKRAVISNTVTTILTPLDKVSPCASNESLTVDQSRDHSDGLWNESQATVLQVDSGTENGTVISSSDLSSLAASPGALALLTPTSRRKQLLLLQHQQRSSLDTDALDEEFDASQSQSPTSPRNKLDTSSSSSQARASLSPPAVVPNISLPITKQPTISKSITPIALPKVNHTPAIAITHPSLDLADVPFRRTPSFINKKRERALSPSRRRDLQKKAQQKEPNGTIPNQIVESPSEPPLAKAASSETSLARTDSGKINTTDVSESTTEDYVTANSDSSKKSNSKIQNQNPENNKTQDGSSFESASSLYSSTRTENIAEDLIVPSFSPPLEINDDFIVPDLASPPLPLSDRLPRVSMEKIEVKADITANIEHIKREKTDIKFKDDLPKVSKTMRGTISGKSSSSGSYSIGGSNPNVTEPNDDKTPTEKIVELPERSESKGKEDKTTATIHEKEQLVPKMMGSLSDDERSVHYSSSGYYESPVEDDDDGGLTYKHSQRYKSTTRPKSWLADEKRRKKKAFTLEFSKSYDDSVSTSQDDWGKKTKDPDSVSQKSERSIFKPSNVKSPQDEKAPETRKKKTHFADKTKSVQSSPREAVDIEKSIKEKISKEKDSESKRPAERERYVKRTKLKPKSPTQSKTVDGNNHSYRQAHYDRREAMGSNMKLHLNIPTSDDSSEQYRKEGTSNGNISPRKHRRLRDSPRRKTGNNSNNAKSPTTANNHTVYRPRRKSGSNESISLPGSLPRRKQSIPTIPHLSSLEAEDIETTRTLTSAGSRLTPLRYIKSPNTSPRHNRKQDKDGKFAKAASAESLRSVSPGSDSVFYSEQTEHSLVGADGESKAHCLHCGKEVHIVTATHEHDSVASRTSHTDESYADATPDIVPAPAGFADSPSCATNKKHANGARLYKKLDKRYRSEDKSRHYYRNRQDVRAKSEERGKEEYATTEKPQDARIARSAGNSLDKLGGSSASVDPDEHEECSGSSEGAEGGRDEKGIYAAPWWCGNWIMLSENNDHWTRIPPDVLDTGSDGGHEDPTESESEFNKRFVALTHRLVHRRACIELNRRQADNSFESDKTVVVRRGNEEFGFRIHGSKPVVVSAIEPDTPAETSGLEVGDIVIAVNGINVLDKTHSEVVKIAHSGSEILELEVARTCEVVASLAHEGGPAALYSGYLWRAAPVRPHHPPHWTRRWFVLKRDNCLYYYKTDSSIHPVGALMLVNYQLTEEDAGRPHGFRLHRGGGVRLQLAADTSEAAARWRAVLAHAIDASNQRDGWLEVTMRNMKLPPSSIPRPDCFGYLMKLGSKWKSWAKRYCVLKDACLYFYNDGNSKNAFGMACLHGYRIQTCAPGGKKYAFEVMPTEPKQRHFYFHTESEMDRKRWMAALEYSIDRWMKAG